MQLPLQVPPIQRGFLHFFPTRTAGIASSAEDAFSRREFLEKGAALSVGGLTAGPMFGQDKDKGPGNGSCSADEIPCDNKCCPKVSHYCMNGQCKLFA